MSHAYCLRPIGLLHLLLNAADLHAKRFVDRPHPVGIALGEVVVHRGEMGTLPFQRGQIQRQRGGERLAFARLHLDDRVVMHGRAAKKLHIEVPHIQPPPAGLAHQRKCLDQQPLERLAAACPIAQRQAGLLEIEIALQLQRLLERSDLRNVPRPLANARTGRGRRRGYRCAGSGRCLTWTRIRTRYTIGRGKLPLDELLHAYCHPSSQRKSGGFKTIAAKPAKSVYRTTRIDLITTGGFGV